MNPFEIRWQNFRSFQDTGWLTIRPLTVIIGPNGSGKTSLLAPFLLLKQTLESTDRKLALRTRGDLFDAGSFNDAVFDKRADRGISLEFRFHQLMKKPAKEKPIGAYPPAEVGLSFISLEGEASPVLQSIESKDLVGRRIFRRTRQKSGNYSITDFPLDKIDSRIKSAIQKDQPVRFLFSNEPIVRTTFKKDLDKKRVQSDEVADEIEIAEVTFTRQAALYLAVITFISSHFDQLLRPLCFIGPLREHPRRVYELLGEKPSQVGIRGEYAPEILNRQRGSQLITKVNEWVKLFGFGFSIECQKCGNDAFSILLNRGGNKPALNLADTGFGLSQVLPLLVQGYYGSSKGLIIAEQPEIHLNPKLQTLLADLFIEVSSTGRGIILETHSEHLLLRLRRLIAEKKIKPEQVSLLYVEQDKGVSKVREIAMEGNGHIDDNDWPKDFFAESLRESLGLAMAQSRSRKDAK